MEWNKRYMNLAKEVSTWSKDPSSQIGAVAIGSKGQVLSQGYNGFPRGIKDTEYRLNNREIKYKHVVHAEMNCIFNATYTGVSLDGASMYVYGLPICTECAKGIIQVGIKKVYMNNIEKPERWKASIEDAQNMFDEAKVRWEIIHNENNHSRD